MREVGHNTEVKTPEEHLKSTWRTPGNDLFHNLNMKTVVSVALLFATLLLFSEAVQVQASSNLFILYLYFVVAIFYLSIKMPAANHRP